MPWSRARPQIFLHLIETNEIDRTVVMRDFWATEAALGFAMLAYNLMSLFRQAVLRTRVQHTLPTLHGLVLAIDMALGATMPTEQTDALRAPSKTRLVRRSLKQRLRSPGHSGSAK
jgi:hypothetical protein